MKTQHFSYTGSGALERDPAIACNSLDHTRLIAFEYSGTGNGDIYGQRVSQHQQRGNSFHDRWVLGSRVQSCCRLGRVRR